MTLNAPVPTVALAPLTTLGVGGAADWFLTASTPDDIASAVEWCDTGRLPLLVLGGGSNLVIADRGFPGLVVRMAIQGCAYDTHGTETHIRAGAGESWDVLVADAVDRGLAGIECLSGIPGSVGGTPIQNVGAYGQEVGDTIESVDVFDRHERTLSTLTSDDCRFSYRMSRFKRDDPDRFIVCAVTFRLSPDKASVAYPDIEAYLRQHGVGEPSLPEVRAAVLAIRRRKGMVIDAVDPDSRSVGSFFMNPQMSKAQHDRVSTVAGVAAPGFPMPADAVKIPAAWLIEHSGFHKGYTDGAVAISSKHPLALVNRGGATADDVLRLATTIKRRVMDRFGVGLRPEPIFVGFGQDERLEYLQRG